MKNDRLRHSTINADEIKSLSIKIKSYFQKSKVNKVRNVALGNPGSGSLWRSVKIAKNLNCESLTARLTLSGVPIATADRAEAFAAFFHEKITSHAQKTKVCQNVYNGKNKIIVQNRNFMQINDVKECMLSLKSKRCEGYDRIPLCIIADACDILLDPFAQLFQKIYATGLIPEQWKVSKINKNSDTDGSIT